MVNVALLLEGYFDVVMQGIEEQLGHTHTEQH
jgi:hypothetical protein